MDTTTIVNAASDKTLIQTLIFIGGIILILAFVIFINRDKKPKKEKKS